MSIKSQKQKINLPDTFQSHAVLSWAKKSEISLDPRRVYIQGEQTWNDRPEEVENDTTRFLKKLMIEENMHLVKMSSKSGKSFVNGLTISQMQEKIKNETADEAQSSINLLLLKQNGKGDRRR